MYKHVQYGASLKTLGEKKDLTIVLTSKNPHQYAKFSLWTKYAICGITNNQMIHSILTNSIFIRKRMYQVYHIFTYS